MSVARLFISTRNGKLAAAGKLQRYSIVAAVLSVLPSACGGQCGFMTVGCTSQGPENSGGTGVPRLSGTAHEVGTPASIVGASCL